MAKEKNIIFRPALLKSRNDAQSAPTPITTYALFYNGEYVTNEQLNDNRFMKFLKKLELIEE